MLHISPMRLCFLALLLALAVGGTACSSDTAGGGGDASSDATTDGSDVDTSGTAGATDDTPAADRCCSAGVCLIGEICLEGVCHAAPPTGSCYYDGECADGQVCDGAVRCTDCLDASCDPQPGQCLWPGECCNSHAECGSGEHCHEGVCRTDPSKGCLLDLHCAAGQVCEGIGSCPCGESGCEAAPGYCSLPGSCCLADGECGAGGQCIGNRCLAEPDAGSCYESSDCSGNQRCVGAFICPCGDESCAIPTTAGVCTAAEEVCCEVASDCTETSVCVAGEACLPAPGGNQCYVDDHCGLGRECIGPQVCNCNDICPTGSSQPGTCQTKKLSCSTDDDCTPGMECIIADAAWCPDEGPPQTGVCVESKDDVCWNTDQCGFNQHCTSETICLDASGCTDANQAGFCQTFTKLGDCCTSHRDCAEGFECRNSNTAMTCPPNGTATCVPTPQYGESCWNYLDCPENLVCNQAYVCACSSKCAKSRIGWCGSPFGQPCKTNVDCGGGFTCAIDIECKLNPCFSGSDCSVSGKCQQNALDACWRHEDCGGGNYCKGLRICPAEIGNCTDPDVAGTCAPLEEIGGCCDSYKACGAGLRCVSSVYETACTLDVSSVCVPKWDNSSPLSCFTDDDCDPSRECVGSTVCACEQDGCDDDPAAGVCALKAP